MVLGVVSVTSYVVYTTALSLSLSLSLFVYAMYIYTYIYIYIYMYMYACFCHSCSMLYGIHHDVGSNMYTYTVQVICVYTYRVYDCHMVS